VEHHVLALNEFQVVGAKHGHEARDDLLNGLREILNAGEATTFVADFKPPQRSRIRQEGYGTLTRTTYF
jgi:hypothetical protein